MEKSRLNKHKYFIERDLFFQTLTLLLTVLLGGFLLLLLSKTISGYIDSSLLFLMLFVGYFLLIIFFAWSLSRKFIGPFSRLKDIMKDISTGDLSLRLQVRDGDDVRIKTFVHDTNRMVITFNNCLEKVRQPCQLMDKKVERLVRSLQSKEPPPQEEYLEALENLQELSREIQGALQQFNTKKRPSYDL